MSELQDFIIKNGILEEYRGSSEVVIIPEGVVKIELWFCKKPERIKRLYLPKSLTSISDSNFSTLKNLEYVFIPSSVKSIGRCAFWDCAKLEHVEIENQNIEVALGAFDGTKFEADMMKTEGAFILGNNLIRAAEEMEKYIVPSHVKTINRDAFKNTKIKEVIVPYGVTKLDICAFAYSSIERISLPDTLKTVEAYAFSNCTNLTKLTIPESVTRISSCAFEQLPNCVLTILNDCEDEELISLAFDSFGRDAPCIKEVHTPYGSVAMRYAKKSGLEVTIIPHSPEKIGRPQKYHYINDEFCCEGSTLHEYFGHQKVVYVPDGISVIGRNAFTNTKVKKVFLPKSVFLIEEYGFADTDLIEITGEAVRIIDQRAFDGCRKLERATFPQLERCYDISFEYCDSLLRENLVIPDDTEIIDIEFTPCTCGNEHIPRTPLNRKTEVNHI